MLRGITQILGLTVLLGVLCAGLMLYRGHYAGEIKLAKLEEEKKALNEVVERLSDEKRVAEMVVTRQETGADGVQVTQLLFVETTKNGVDLPAKSFTVRGKFVHIDALVIKFDRQFVKQGDALRGHSIALFTQIYGDRQTPADAARIDDPGSIPDIYKDADPLVTEFETTLWKNFWHLAEDRSYAAAQGVRVANGQGVWGMFSPDRLYTLTLETDGGLNLSSEPLKGIYKEALKRR